MILTEDLIQWLLADQKVCNGWKGLADRLELTHLVPFIIEDPQKCKLKLLLTSWKQARSDTYTVETLKIILSQEGFTDMYRWICLMTVGSPNKPEPEPFRSRNHFSSRSFSVRSRPKVRPQVTPSPMSDYLYSPSPYTEFFGSPRQLLRTSSGSSSSGLTPLSEVSQLTRSFSSSSSVSSPLFKPDLIKMSSPLSAKYKAEQEREQWSYRSSPSSETSRATRNREDFTKNWIENNKQLYQK